MLQPPDNQESYFLIKNILKTTISSISYLRDLFDEKNFEQCSLANVSMKILKPIDKEAIVLQQFLDENVVEPFEQKELKRVCFGIYHDPKGFGMIEQYEYIIEYKDVESSELGSHTDNNSHPLIQQAKTHDKSTKSLFKKTKKDVIQETKKVIEELLQLTENFVILPTNRHVIMKSYNKQHNIKHDENSQSDYFENITIGTIETEYHKLTLKVISNKSLTLEDNSFAILRSNFSSYRNGVKPTLLNIPKSVCLNVSFDNSNNNNSNNNIHEGLSNNSNSNNSNNNNSKYESHGKLYKHRSMLTESSADDSEKKVASKLENTNNSHDVDNTAPLTEKDIREVSKVFMCNGDKTKRLTGVELLRILEDDAEKFGEKTQLKALVKRSPMSHLLKTMMKGSGEHSCAVYMYPALEKLAELGCIELISVDNGKNPDYNKPELRDSKSNLKSNSIIVVTDFGRKFLDNSKRGKGRPLGSSKKSNKKGQKSKKKIITDEKEYHPKRKRKWEDSEAAITLGIVTPGDYAFNIKEPSHKCEGSELVCNTNVDGREFKRQKDM